MPYRGPTNNGSHFGTLQHQRPQHNSQIERDEQGNIVNVTRPTGQTTALAVQVTQNQNQNNNQSTGGGVPL